MTTFEKLAKKIEADTGLKVENLQRTYASRNQLEGWAWSWSGNIKNAFIRVGSWMSATDLLKEETLEAKPSHGDWEIV